MSGNLPMVSVCIPTRNSARYLETALNSIAAQTWENIEVLIGDNASTDDTLDIAETYAHRYGWKLLRSSHDLGPFGNWNRLVAAAGGDYIAIYHSDDCYEPTVVAESVAVLESNPEFGLVGTLATVIDGKGDEQFHVRLPEGVEAAPSYRFEEVFRAILGNGGDRIFLVTPTVMVRRRVYAELGTFDTSGQFASAGDYEMWLRIAARNPVAVIPRPLMRYRVHAGQGSETELRRNLELPDLLAVLERYSELIEDHDIRLAYDCYRSRTYLKTALKQNCAGDFSSSSMTAGLIRSGRYLPAGTLVRIANRFGINLRCWPGRAWPCSVPAGSD